MSDMNESSVLTRATAWLALAGAACIFGSWIAENYLQRVAEADAQRLERIFATVFSEEQQKTQWLIEYNRAVSECPQNRDMVGLAAANLSKTLLQLLQGGQAAIASTFSDYSASLRQKRDQSVEVDRLLQTKDYERLVANLNDLMARYEMEIEAIAGQQALEWLDASRRSNEWNHRFLALYILGSSLLGFSYLSRHWSILFGHVGRGSPRGPRAGASVRRPDGKRASNERA